jgi:hypothetical protein
MNPYTGSLMIFFLLVKEYWFSVPKFINCFRNLFRKASLTRYLLKIHHFLFVKFKKMVLSLHPNRRVRMA